MTRVKILFTVKVITRQKLDGVKSNYDLPSVLWHCWLDGRKGIWPVKNMGDDGGGHWLVQMEWRPAGWLVCLPLLIFPCTSSLLAPDHPGDPEKGL